MKKVIYILTLSVLMAACRKPYNPPAIGQVGSYLVVAGVINSGTDSTTINLSRTVKVSNKVTNNPVTGATVAVESDQNTVYVLNETTNGNYVSAGLNLDNTRQYRLRIKTPDNQQYLSDFVPVVITPPIDSIGYDIVNNVETGQAGIQLYVNTHDASNKVKYFRWDYLENWAFHTKYDAIYIPNGPTMAIRQPDQRIDVCYATENSSNIVLNSTAKLKQDVVYQQPVLFIPSTSEKIESRYAILLRQYPLTADAYNFWSNIKKNTEQLGSIFDAQPSQPPTNIHNITNPQQPVIGYLSVGTIASKRIIILNAQLPNWATPYPYTCEVDTGGYYENWPYVAIGPPPGPGGSIPSVFYFTTHECADCTIRGSVTPPPFFQ